MKTKKNSKYIMPVIVIGLLSAVFSLFASTSPDGLERVAIDSGFIDKEKTTWTFALFPDYSIPAFANSVIGNSMAGLLGAVLIFGFVWLIGKWLTKEQVDY